MHRYRSRNYLYNDLIFDSSWELAFYIYHKDNNIDIDRCVKSFPYVVNNKTHYYFPDFIVDNKLIEIKGPHLID